MYSSISRKVKWERLLYSHLLTAALVVVILQQQQPQQQHQLSHDNCTEWCDVTHSFNILLISFRFSVHKFSSLSHFFFHRSICSVAIRVTVCRLFFLKPFSRLSHAVCNGIIPMQCFLVSYTFLARFLSYFFLSVSLPRFLSVLVCPNAASEKKKRKRFLCQQNDLGYRDRERRKSEARVLLHYILCVGLPWSNFLNITNTHRLIEWAIPISLTFNFRSTNPKQR